jgi:hypothetical protein
MWLEAQDVPVFNHFVLNDSTSEENLKIMNSVEEMINNSTCKSVLIFPVQRSKIRFTFVHYVVVKREIFSFQEATIFLSLNSFRNNISFSANYEYVVLFNLRFFVL